MDSPATEFGDEPFRVYLPNTRLPVVAFLGLRCVPSLLLVSVFGFTKMTRWRRWSSPWASLICVLVLKVRQRDKE